MFFGRRRVGALKGDFVVLAWGQPYGILLGQGGVSLDQYLQGKVPWKYDALWTKTPCGKILH